MVEGPDRGVKKERTRRMGDIKNGRKKGRGERMEKKLEREENVFVSVCERYR